MAFTYPLMNACNDSESKFRSFGAECEFWC